MFSEGGYFMQNVVALVNPVMKHFLVFIDYPTGKRIPKDSLDWYGQVVCGGGIPD